MDQSTRELIAALRSIRATEASQRPEETIEEVIFSVSVQEPVKASVIDWRKCGF